MTDIQDAVIGLILIGIALFAILTDGRRK